jgi:hypothetical protein
MRSLSLPQLTSHMTGEPLPTKELQNVIDTATSGKRSIIGCDANAHHTLLGGGGGGHRHQSQRRKFYGIFGEFKTEYS